MQNFLPLTVLIILLACTTVNSQPKFYFSPQDTILVDPGATTTLEIRVVDFTEIVEARFSIRWDPAVSDLIELTDTHPNLNVAPENYTINNDEGYLTFALGSYDAVSCDNPAASLPDSALFFIASFTGLEGTTDVYFTDDPTGLFFTRMSTCPLDILCFCIDTAQIQVNPMPTSSSLALKEEPATAIVPNPSGGWLTLVAPKDRSLPVSVRIVDSGGKEWAHIDRPTSFLVDGRGLIPGFYYIIVLWKDGRQEVLPVVRL
jgi:hypothetical protein